MRPPGRRPKARLASVIGRKAERLALIYLLAKGYRPLARRFGGKGGEIDLIVKRGRTVAFVEVKARGVLENALTAITAKKHQLITARVRHWLARNPWAMDHDLRVDAVFVAPWRWPRHVPGVYDLVL